MFETFRRLFFICFFSIVELPPILVPRNHGETLPPHSEILSEDDIAGGQVPANHDLPPDLDEMELLASFSEVGSPTFSGDEMEMNDDQSMLGK